MIVAFHHWVWESNCVQTGYVEIGRHPSSFGRSKQWADGLKSGPSRRQCPNSCLQQDAAMEKHNIKTQNYITVRTRSSKRTRIAYFPVNLILKETLMVWNRTVSIVGSRNRLSNDRRTETRTDRRTQFNKNKYLVKYLSNKKIIFKIGLLERHLTILSVRPSVWTDRQTKSAKDRFLMSYVSNKREFWKSDG